jgi:hypothetical protein
MRLVHATGPGSRISTAEAEIVCYGWDSPTETWRGPDTLNLPIAPARRLLQVLQSAAGPSWYGPVTCCAPGEPEARFFALVHDLADCGMAMIYCDESKMGPAEILVVIPPERRARLRPDFAFEFLAFARFMNAASAGAELQLHDGIAAAINAAAGSDTVVFSVSSGMWPHDLEHVLSRCVEKVAVAMCQWLPDRICRTAA